MPLHLRTTAAVALLLLAAAAPVSMLPAVAQEDPQEEAMATVSFTAAQVERGRNDYRRSCLDCHGASLDDGEFGGAPLKGNSFREKWFGTTADVLYGYISAVMPPDRPGRLNPQTYADLTAYILSANGIQPGTVELPPDLDTLANLKIE